MQGSKSSFKLPDAEDKENLPVKIATSELNKKTLPLFIKYDESSNTLNIEPAINEKTGVYKISVKVTDSLGAFTSYSFKVEVQSDAKDTEENVAADVSSGNSAEE